MQGFQKHVLSIEPKISDFLHIFEAAESRVR